MVEFLETMVGKMYTSNQFHLHLKTSFLPKFQTQIVTREKLLKHFRVKHLLVKFWCNAVVLNLF